MSTTMTMTLPPTTTVTSATTILSTINEISCPNCGLALAPSSADTNTDPHTALLQAQRQIEDLQAQVRLLNQKATAAVDRWADYEDELSRLRAASTSTNSTAATSSKSHDVSNGNINNRPQTPDPSVSASTRSSFLGAGAASRISQLLSPRKAAAAAAAAAASGGGQPTTTPQQQPQRGGLSPSALPPNGNGGGGISNTAEAKELIAALTNERRLRAAAEDKLTATNRELEDLSASLFEQANNMVATERRARAALEERVNLLGKRDEEKRARIGLLETAVLRLERAREMLAGKAEEAEEARRREEEEDDNESEKEGEGETTNAKDGTAKHVDKDGGHVVVVKEGG